MQIIAGIARNIILNVPAGLEVRPTAARSRKALFDSLGDFSGCNVLDLFSGSGALALEAASRGAAAITMVELEPRHLRVIGENLARVQKAGVQCKANLLNCSALEPRRYSIPAGSPDLILADPPYPRSAEFFGRLMRDEFFRMHFAGARLVWELPDTPGAVGLFLEASGLAEMEIRKFGSTSFLLGKVQP